MSTRSTLPRLGRDLGIVLATIWVLVVASGGLGALEPGFDAHAYWLTRFGDFYAQGGLGSTNAFLYSPAFAQVLAPLTALSWNLFIAAWTGLILAAYLWLTGPLAVPLAFLFPVFFEIHEANIHILLAAMLVLSERHPAAWAFGLLTKGTPGVGLVWYVTRREWRHLAMAVGVTVAVSAASFAAAPDAWRAWVQLLVSSNGVNPATPYLAVPLLPRVLVAAVLVAWGARAGRRWVLPVAVTMALPIVWINSFTILLALVPGLRRRWRGRTSARVAVVVPATA